MRILRNTTGTFLLLACRLSLLGCFGTQSTHINQTTLGTWSITSANSLPLADVTVHQVKGQLTTVRVLIQLKRPHDVVDVSLGLPTCFQPFTRTTAQWTQVGSGTLSWMTHWRNAGGCYSRQATLLYQFTANTEGAKGRLVFSVVGL